MKSKRKKKKTKEGKGMQAELIALIFICLETDAEQISLQCSAFFHEQAITFGQKQSCLKYS